MWWTVVWMIQICRWATFSQHDWRIRGIVEFMDFHVCPCKIEWRRMRWADFYGDFYQWIVGCLLQRRECVSPRCSKHLWIRRKSETSWISGFGVELEELRSSPRQAVWRKHQTAICSRPNMSVCILGDAFHCDIAKANDIPFRTVDDLKKLNKDKKEIKKLAKSFGAFLASDSVIKQIPKLLGPGLNRAGKFPAPITTRTICSRKSMKPVWPSSSSTRSRPAWGPRRNGGDERGWAGCQHHVDDQLFRVAAEKDVAKHRVGLHQIDDGKALRIYWFLINCCWELELYFLWWRSIWRARDCRCLSSPKQRISGCWDWSNTSYRTRIQGIGMYMWKENCETNFWIENPTIRNWISGQPPIPSMCWSLWRRRNCSSFRVALSKPGSADNSDLFEWIAGISDDVRSDVSLWICGADQNTHRSEFSKTTECTISRINPTEETESSTCWMRWWWTEDQLHLW